MSSGSSADELTAGARYIILTAAFLGWMFSGFQMAVMTLAARSATTEFLRSGHVSAERPLAAERLILLSSGGSDWLPGSGSARKVEGGYRVTARKVFASGAPVADLFMTGAVVEAEDGARSVIHFAAPMKAPEVRVVETWKALGMRGTGSHDVAIEDLFVPDAGVSLTRPAGRWHPAFHVITMIAIPLIFAYTMFR